MKQTSTLKRVLSFVMALAMILTLLPTAVSAATITGGAKLYLKPNSNWKEADARFAAYFFNSTTNTNKWVSMTATGVDDIYVVTAPTGTWTNVIFCRMNPSASSNSWNNKWAQTADLVFDGTKNLYSITAGSWDAGTWSVYENPTFTVAGVEALCGTNWNTNDTANDMTLNEQGLYEKVFENVAAGTYTFKVAANHAWTYSWGEGSADKSVTVAENGSTVKILFNFDTKAISTEVTVPAPATYAVTFQGTNVTATGATGENAVTHGQAYTTTLQAAAGYNLPETVEVKVGGTAVTGYTYEEGVLTIPADLVIGEISITAEGVAKTYRVRVTGSQIIHGEAVDATHGKDYTIMLIAAEGYALSESDITVTVAGEEVEFTYNSGTLTVPKAAVSGDIVITAIGKEAVPDTVVVTFIGEHITFEGANPAPVGEDYTVKLTAKDGYNLPETVTVIADGVALAQGYTYAGGVVTIAGEKVTGPIAIKAVGVAKTYDVTFSLTNLTREGEATATHGVQYTATLAAAEGYILPEAVTVTVGGEAVEVDYDSTTGVLAIAAEDVTGPIVITAEGESLYTAYFVNSAKWSEVAAHAWIEGGAGTEWPGIAMTKTGETVNGFDVYSVSFDVAYEKIIFNNNNKGSQTGDLTFEVGKYYDLGSNAWYESLEDIPAPDPLATGCFLVGSMNGWNTTTHEFKLTEEGGKVGSLTLTLDSDTYEFKVTVDGVWCGNSGTIDNTTAGNGWEMKSSETANCTLKASGGEYTFEFDTSTNKLNVTHTPNASTYYLIGYINGADYGDGADSDNLGDYQFVDGQVTATFETDSYVCVKSSAKTWYMTDGWQGAVDSATLYKTSGLGEDADKLAVPGGVEITFTLAENEDGTLTLSYEADNSFLTDETGIQDGTTLHAWNWSFANIEKNLAKIKALGYTAVQTSPIQPLKETTTDEEKFVGSHWWVYYQPIDFVITDGEGNALGTKAEFESMCKAADELGIRIIVDVVANHLANEEKSEGVYGLSSKIPEKLQASEYWHTTSVDISQDDYKNGNRAGITQKCMGGLPDLKTQNAEIQAMVLDFLKQCINLGVDGFRFDAAKHIEVEADGLESDGEVNFWTAVVGGAKEYAESVGKDIYVYGEFLDATSGTAAAYYTEYMAITDNSWGNSLRGDVVSGKADALNRGYDKIAPADHLVVWAESHDTYANTDGGSTNVSQANINKTWALAASRADVMGLYFARPASLETSKLGAADVTGWANAEVEAVNDFKNAFRGAEETVGVEDGIAYVVRGDKGVVLVSTGAGNSVSMELPLADGTYVDQVTGNIFTVADGTVSGTIGATGIAVVHNVEYSVEFGGENLTFQGEAKANRAENYTATLMPAEGYAVPTAVTVTVDGMELAAEDYTFSGGRLTVPAEKITGDIRITAETALLPKETYNVTLVSTTVESDGEATVKENTAYTAKLTAKTGYTLPGTIEVKVGDTVLAEGYTYENGQLTIDAEQVIGHIVITVAGIPNTYTVTFSLTDLKEMEAAEATHGAAYTAKLETVEGYNLPESITVKVGETTLTAGTDYTYANGELTIKAEAVTGDITVTAAGVAIPVGTVTVYFRNDWLWNEVYVYYWGSAGENPSAMPGVAMTKVGAALYNGELRDVYSAEIPADAAGLIFNGNNQQTPDVTDFEDGDAFYIHWDGENKCSKFEYDPNAEPPKPSTTYSITGSFTSPSWSPENGDVMTDEDNDGIYEYTYDYMAAGTNSFKVTTGSWNPSWGGTGENGNYEILLEEPSTVTIKFNANTKQISYVAVPLAIEEPVTDVTVHFRNADVWSLVNAYVWDLGDPDTVPNGPWPGTALTENADHANWYTAQITGQNCPDGIGFIFNSFVDGSGSQSENIYITKNGEYWYDGQLLTEAPETWDDGTVETASYKAILHFANNAQWETVNFYTWLSNGTNLTGAWPGAAVKMDAEGFYTATVEYETVAGSDLNFIFSGGGTQTVDKKLTASDFVLDGETGVCVAEKWIAVTTPADDKFNAAILNGPEGIVESPVVVGKTVTFKYGDDAASAVSVAGTFNDWTPIPMSKVDGVWTATVENLAPGDYQYKFVITYPDKEEAEWRLDPMNGSVFTEPGGNQNSSFFILHDLSTKDDNTVTIRIHYKRDDGNYENWNLWVWGSNMGGHQVDFTETDENGAKVAIIKLENEARDHLSIGFKERKSLKGNEWAEKPNPDVDRIIDLSTIVSGTIDYYVPDCTASYTDVIRKNKVNSVELDYDSGTILFKTTAALSSATDVTLVRNGEAIATTNTSRGSTCIIALPEDQPIDLVTLHEYRLIFEDHPYAIGLDAVYASERFAKEFTYEGNDLGASYTDSKTTFKLWAPTAAAVAVELYATGSDAETGAKHLGSYAMESGDKGVWTAQIPGDLNGVYYTYKVTRSGQTVEACDPYARTTGVNGQRAMILDLDATDPSGWKQDTNPNPIASYTDAVIYELHVRDFSIDDSSGVSTANRGKFLAFTEEGTTTANGISTGIDYLDDLDITHLHLLPVYDYGSVDETACDTFNWGYDPVNYNVPEGSYSTNPYDGASRVSEMKQMIRSLHDHDISVIMDVVYNHVYNADKFCFNQIVPGYFSRVDSNTSGCGNDTASEREMVSKYIVESVLYWHQEYHIDGFRFDLVGLIDTETINQVVQTVHACCPDVIFYGEGWDMDSTNKEPGTEMAKQGNASKTPGFAYFSDSMRDLIAGSNGSSLGFVSGQAEKEAQLINEFMAKPISWGNTWTTNPQQVVQYVSCHDNHTLADKLIVSTGKSGLDEEIVRMNNLSAVIYMTSQGIPFIHAGEEMLREKINPDGSRNHNSYNSSDEVNHIEWSNLEKEMYAEVSDYYRGLIQLRKSHAALRLDTAAKVESYIEAYVRGEKLLQFTFDAKAAGDIAESIIVVFNANTSSQTVYLPAGEWNVCVNANEAGTKVLDTVEGSVTVDGVSALVLVKGETCVHEYEGSCDALECVHCGDKTAKEHSFTDKASDKQATAADCDNAATYYVQCDNCDEIHETKTVSVGEKAGHDFEDGKCTVCGEADPDYVKPTEPDPTEPDPTEPEATEPDPSEPEVTEPDPTEPDATEPEVKVEGTTRLAGENRILTSFLIADQLKAQMGVEKFDAIIVASGSTYADALPGSYLSAVKNAPIVLTLAKDKYILQTADYIKANLAVGGTVYVLGGESAVPASIEAALAGIKVQRVAGDNRFFTNMEILKAGGVKAGDEILVCTAKDYADSLSASATGKAILLVYKALTEEQKDFLTGLKGSKFVLIGGTSAVPESFVKELEAYGQVSRLAGKDRLETSTLVAEKYFSGAETAVVAYGWDFPDGLCGGSLAYATKSPLLLTHSKEKLYTFTAAFTVKAGIKAGYVLGGNKLVDDAATRAIFGMAAGAKIHVLELKA